MDFALKQAGPDWTFINWLAEWGPEPIPATTATTTIGWRISTHRSAILQKVPRTGEYTNIWGFESWEFSLRTQTPGFVSAAIRQILEAKHSPVIYTWLESVSYFDILKLWDGLDGLRELLKFIAILLNSDLDEGEVDWGGQVRSTMERMQFREESVFITCLWDPMEGCVETKSQESAFSPFTPDHRQSEKPNSQQSNWA